MLFQRKKRTAKAPKVGKSSKKVGKSTTLQPVHSGHSAKIIILNINNDHIEHFVEMAGHTAQMISNHGGNTLEM